MIHQHVAQQGRMAAGARLWRQGDDVPQWMRDAMLGPVEANGTFLIRATLGQQRVHPDMVVVEQLGEIYACPAAEVGERIKCTAAVEEISASPKAAIGPGKSLRDAIPKRRGGHRLAAVPKRRSYPPVKGTPPSIEWIAVGDLMVDDSYQRSIDNEPSQRLIASIAARWDWRLCMPLAVSRRIDGRYVLDGQHRLAAAHMRGDIPHLPCSVATYDGPADEAGMFVAANRARRAINRLDDFHAALVAGDEDALEVQRVVAASGLRVSRKTGSQSWVPGEVAFTSSIQAVLSKHGEELVVVALSAIRNAFHDQVLMQGGSVFLGLTRILVSPPEGLDRQRLFRALSTRPMKDWGAFVSGVKGGDTRAQMMRQALLDAYASIR